jgi:hypothetical protein
MRRLAVVSLLVAVLLPSTGADADFTPATLVSGAARIPFEEASVPAISEDGRYIVFRGKLAGVPGVYRRDLLNGEVTLVAGAFALLPGADEAEKALNAPNATAPSVSADGRYVAFTTSAALTANAHRCPNVYVRDMDEPPTGPHAYTLASAPSGTGNGLIYANACEEGEETALSIAGAQAAPGVALSADGRKVAFTVLSESDLITANPETGEGPPTTPITQVAVRDLDTQTTTLVSATPEGKPIEGGGAYPSAASYSQGVSPESVIGEQPTASTAAISADGSTVAWLGTNVPAQVPPANDVLTGTEGLGGPEKEIEPLWRRVADGPSAVTRRLLNEAGLSFYTHEEQEAGNTVESGSLYFGTNEFFVAPALSADGSSVATISNAPTAPNEASYKFLNRTSGRHLPPEAYVIHVDRNPAIPPQVTPLTATPNFNLANLSYQFVWDVAISPGGSRVAFDTPTTSFALAPPTLISPPAPETLDGYTYEANLQLGTLQRVTSTFDGSPPNGRASQLSFTADGQTLAFASSAGNLIFGAPQGHSQVYLTHEVPGPSGVAAQSVGGPPEQPPPTPDWLLSATATAQPDGSVLVDAHVPAAGTLGVRVTAQLPALLAQTPARRPSRRARRRKHKARSSSHRIARGRVRPYRRAKPHRRGKRTLSGGVAPARTVAEGALASAGPSELTLRLPVQARYQNLVATPDGLYCLVRVTFTAPGRPPLSQEIWVTLHAPPPKKSGKAARKRTRAAGIPR